MSRNGKVVLVTGASSGIGAAVAARLCDSGHTVFGTSRRSDAAAPRAGVRMLTMDVRSEESISAAVAAIVAASNRLDVVINNAGFGLAGAVEDTAADDLR